jgi:thiol-disulfide isomerase/thioredoxin
MNLILRPLSDVNDVTWSIIWILIILLSGVFYVIVYILIGAPNVSAKYRIRSIPTIVTFKNGVEVDRMSGALPAPQFQEWVRRFL